MATIAELRYGNLDDVASAVDVQDLDTGELRSVILNLIDRIQRLEKHANNKG